jgi:hypothetical protein
MKLTELNNKKNPPVAEVRYRVTLSTEVGGNLVAWQTRLNAGSPRDAVDIAQRLYLKQRGEIQSAIMQKMDLREVTPLAQKK